MLWPGWSTALKLTPLTVTEPPDCVNVPFHSWLIVPRTVNVKAGDVEFEARVRIDTPKEAEYFRHGGILQYVLRTLLAR